MGAFSFVFYANDWTQCKEENTLPPLSLNSKMVPGEFPIGKKENTHL